MLTREEIIQRLRDLRRYDLAAYDYEDYVIEPDDNGDYHLRDDIIAIIKEAESE